MMKFTTSKMTEFDWNAGIKLRLHFLFLVSCILLLLSSSVLAQSNAGYDLTWSTVNSGGGTFSAGGDYSLGGTLGQPDAGVMSGGMYTLSGGFWSGGSIVAPQNYISLPLVMRNP